MHEGLEVWVETLFDMLFVVLVEGGAIGCPEVGSHDLEPLVFEAAGDSTNQSTFDGVRLADDKSTVHAEQAND